MNLINNSEGTFFTNKKITPPEQEEIEKQERKSQEQKEESMRQTGAAMARKMQEQQKQTETAMETKMQEQQTAMKANVSRKIEELEAKMKQMETTTAQTPSGPESQSSPLALVRIFTSWFHVYYS